jgi:hypothetical protein
LFANISIHAQSDPRLDRIMVSDDVSADIELLCAVLEENHPAIGCEISSERFRTICDSLINIHSSATLRGTFFLISEIIDHLEDGHTRVRWNSDQRSYIWNTKGIVPVDLNFDGNRAFVAKTDLIRDLVQGDEVLAINGIGISEIVRTLETYVSCDGETRDSENAILTKNFPWLLGAHYGFIHEYEIVVRRAGSYLEEEVYCWANIPSEEINSQADEQDFNLKTEEKTAWLRISRFYGIGPAAYRRFLKKSFKMVRKLEVDHLVIDIRGNGGGREGYDNLLLSYLNNNLSEKYASVTTKSLKSNYYDHLETGFRERLKNLIYRSVEFRSEENTWHRRDRFAGTLRDRKPGFDGNVYVLVDGAVFSSASDFAALAQAYVKHCLVIGTETLGGSHGNSGGYYYQLKLPRSGFVVDIPRIRFELEIPGKGTRQGVVPDVIVAGNRESTGLGDDSYQLTVRSLIDNNHQIIVQESDK